MSETLFFAGWAVLFVMALIWLMLVHRLFRRLRQHHAPTYESLGSPTIFRNNSPRHNWLFAKFLFGSEWKSLGDPRIIRQCFILRAYLCVYIAILLSLFLLFRAHAREAKAEYRQALSDFGEAVRIHPQDAASWGAKAWLEATCPDAEYRDGKQAVEDATKASQLTNGKDIRILEALAAAHAEAGDFASAVTWQEKALELAPEKLKPSVRFRLDLYNSHRPYHQKAATR